VGAGKLAAVAALATDKGKECDMEARSTVLAACMAAALSGCYVIPIEPTRTPGQVMTLPVPTTLQARLYPVNETAGKTGALTATVVDTGNGHASFSVTYAGELLQGEASRVSGGGAGRGIASAAGPRGTYVNCEYALRGPNTGTGACQFSTGAKYQLHFGG
jgi:hypothetical protein